MNELKQIKAELEKELNAKIKSTVDFDNEYDHGFRNGLRTAIDIVIKHIQNLPLKEPVQKSKVLEQLESLESEYNAYHTNRDYWRGIKYAIDVMKER